MKGMTLIVKTISRLIIGFIVVFAASIILKGHLTPGGGFAGGVILAAALILLVLALGKKTALEVISHKSLTIWDCIGAFAFLLIAFIGYSRGYFFKNFLDSGTVMSQFSGGTIMYNNIFIGIKVASSISAVFLALVLFRIRGKD